MKRAFEYHKRGDVSTRYIPKDARELADTESDAVVYLSERAGAPYGIGYCGKRAKADWNYRFRSEASRDQEVQRFFANRRASLAYKAEQKAKAKEPTADNGSIGLAEVSKMIKRRLSGLWPGVRFSVRSESYSMGSSIRVSWTDGPTKNQVKNIAGEYSSRDFDGMIDMAYSYDHWLFPDGRIMTAGTRGTVGSGGIVPVYEQVKPHPDARRVSLHSGYVFCDREVSEGAKAGIRAAWAAMTPHERHLLWCKVRPDAGQYRGPGGWPDSFSLEDPELGDFSESQRDHIVWAIARDTPLPAAA